MHFQNSAEIRSFAYGAIVFCHDLDVRTARRPNPSNAFDAVLPLKLSTMFDRRRRGLRTVYLDNQAGLVLARAKGRAKPTFQNRCKVAHPWSLHGVSRVFVEPNLVLDHACRGFAHARSTYIEVPPHVAMELSCRRSCC